MKKCILSLAILIILITSCSKEATSPITDATANDSSSITASEAYASINGIIHPVIGILNTCYDNGIYHVTVKFSLCTQYDWETVQYYVNGVIVDFISLQGGNGTYTLDVSTKDKGKIGVIKAHVYQVKNNQGTFYNAKDVAVNGGCQ